VCHSVYFVVIVIVKTKNYCVTTAVLQFTKEIVIVEHSSYILTIEEVLLLFYFLW
jgi:hypothetical protein